MANERRNSSDLTSFIEDYISSNYPVAQEAVNAVINEFADSARNIGFQVALLKKRAVFSAMDHGIVKAIDDEHFPSYHVPTLLAAIRKIEKIASNEEKTVPLPLEVKILAVAEFTAAKHFADENSMDLARWSAQRGIELTKFSDRMKRMKEYSWYYSKARQ